MNLLLRPSFPAAARIYASRAMSSLAAGQVLQGAQWDYRIVDALKGDKTLASAVFKAKVIPRENGLDNSPAWALIKTVSPDDESGILCLERECQNYPLPGIASAKCFRTMYDVLDSRTVALEWLDTTLAGIKYKHDTPTIAMIKTVLREALTSCEILAAKKYVNTDFKPANILLSGIESGRITAKVGDLELIVPENYLYNAQPFAMRAPEVYLSQPCNAPSQIWAVAAMMFCWIKPRVLGAWGSPHPILSASWSMAKLKRLFPHWHIPPPEEFERPVLQSQVRAAVCMSREEPGPLAISTFEEEAQKVDMPEQLRQLLHFMLVVNPVERPSASDVLASKEFLAFQSL